MSHRQEPECSENCTCVERCLWQQQEMVRLNKHIAALEKEVNALLNREEGKEW